MTEILPVVEWASLPAISDKRLAVRVRPAAEKHIRQGHPWLFADSIASVNDDGRAGDLAIIFDKKRQFLAIGLYDPASPIRIKVLHHGRPTPIDDTFWQQRIQAAQARRTSITPDTTAYRCIHGENDGFPGFVMDRYEQTLVLKLYSAIWLPHLANLFDLIMAQYRPERIVLRLGRNLASQQTFGLTDGMILLDNQTSEVLETSEVLRPILFRENGLIFEADVIKGQKTGHFLDQRDNRGRIRQMAQGKSVLDVFACTGGFSLYAAAGGATSVVSIDRSRFALTQAERNFAHNQHLPTVARCAHTTIVDDAFAVLRRLAAEKQQFDIVVIDPPAFAQKQADIPAALQAYSKLAKLGVAVTKRGGDLILASCSSRVSAAQFQTTITDAIGQHITIDTITEHAIDHPITFPEGAYLNCIFARSTSG